MRIRFPPACGLFCFLSQSHGLLIRCPLPCLLDPPGYLVSWTLAHHIALQSHSHHFDGNMSQIARTPFFVHDQDSVSTEVITPRGPCEQYVAVMDRRPSQCTKIGLYGLVASGGHKSLRTTVLCTTVTTHPEHGIKSNFSLAFFRGPTRTILCLLASFPGMPPHCPPITTFHPTTPIVLSLFPRGQRVSTYWYLLKLSACLQYGVLLSARPTHIKWDTSVLYCAQPLMLPRGLTASQIQ